MIGEVLRQSGIRMQEKENLPFRHARPPVELRSPAFRASEDGRPQVPGHLSRAIPAPSVNDYHFDILSAMRAQDSPAHESFFVERCDYDAYRPAGCAPGRSAPDIKILGTIHVGKHREQTNGDTPPARRRHRLLKDR